MSEKGVGVVGGGEGGGEGVSPLLLTGKYKTPPPAFATAEIALTIARVSFAIPFPLIIQYIKGKYKTINNIIPWLRSQLH